MEAALRTLRSMAGPQDDAAETWRVLVGVFLYQRDRFLALARDLGITPVHVQTLRMLRAAPCPMRALAAELQCDASNVTAIIDRLEARGYVERRPSVTDRRVKLVVLTAEGISAADRVEAALYEPPAAMASLTATERAALRSLASRLAGGNDAAPTQPS